MKDNVFTLYPAIDIKDGKCVRLLFGEMEKETVYNNSPLDQAMWFVDQGAEWLHIVDLDGAVTGKNVNKRVIEKILHKLHNKVKIQIGGGIRNINDIDFWIKNSVDRVILGTLVLENPNFINQLNKDYSKKGRYANIRLGMSIAAYLINKNYFFLKKCKNIKLLELSLQKEKSKKCLKY